MNGSAPKSPLTGSQSCPKKKLEPELCSDSLRLAISSADDQHDDGEDGKGGQQRSPRGRPRPECWLLRGVLRGSSAAPSACRRLRSAGPALASGGMDVTGF